MTDGSTPATAVESLAPAASSCSRVPIATDDRSAEAPSLIPEELPAVTEPPSRNAGRASPAFHGCVGAGMLVARDYDGLALRLRDLDRHDLVVEAALFDWPRLHASGFERERVLLFPRTPPLCDVLAGLPIENGSSISASLGS